MDKSLEKNLKNPMLLSPVISCILKFLSIEDMKNCRLISHEWNSNGKIALANCITIGFHKKGSLPRLPVDFHSCFLESVTLFSAFKISGYLNSESPPCDPWTTEELAKFFDEQQKYIKELTLNFGDCRAKIMKTSDISSWIWKSPMVKNDTKYMTKLVIERDGRMLDVPLNLITNIKELTLAQCRIHVEAGVKICSIILKLQFATFYQDGQKLDHIRINDVVDFSKAKEVSLHGAQNITTYVVDLAGKVTLDKLLLLGHFEIVNGETSHWVVKQLGMRFLPYCLNSRMQIEELHLSFTNNVDLFKLPNSIKKLTVVDHNNTVVSQPIVLENLQYLHINSHHCDYYYSFSSHLVNYPQLTHLQLDGFGGMEIKSNCLPQSVKTLILQDTAINWVEDSYLNLEKLVLRQRNFILKDQCKGKIRVDHVLYQWNMDFDSLDDFAEFRNGFSFGKRLYIGEFKWGEMKLEYSHFEELVDVKSSFYVFENGEMGRAISKEIFFELIPKHLTVS